MNPLDEILGKGPAKPVPEKKETAAKKILTPIHTSTEVKDEQKPTGESTEKSPESKSTPQPPASAESKPAEVNPGPEQKPAPEPKKAAKEKKGDDSAPAPKKKSDPDYGLVRKPSSGRDMAYFTSISDSLEKKSLPDALKSVDVDPADFFSRFNITITDTFVSIGSYTIDSEIGGYRLV